MNIGAHVSIGKGIENAPELAGRFGCETMQIFTRSPQGGPFSEITEETAKKFRTNCQKFGIKNVCVHTPYFINFASNNNRIRYGSISSVKTELERASLLGAKYVMTHLGSAKDLGEKESVKKTIDGLEKVFEEYSGSAKLLIENSAGAGQIIGSNFKQIGEILRILKTSSSFSSKTDVDEEARRRPSSMRVGVCLDTQHSFASGYDWKDNFNNALKEIEKNIGLENIKLIHANDSATELGSHKDRHAHIGKGKIGLEGLEKMVVFAKKQDIDMICETAYPGVVTDIGILKKLRENAQ